MSNLKYVNDDEEFNALMKTAQNDLVVVDFYTTWCGPCRLMEPVIASMVMKHPKVWFLKVDADKCFETAMSHGVKGVPLFVVYMNKLIMDQIQGAHPQLLDQKVSYYEQELKKAIPSVSHLPDDDDSGQLSQIISSVGGIREVTPYLDEKGCRCINDLQPTAFDGFVNGKKLVSGKGSGKVVLVYSFKRRLMLHSFKIKAHPQTGPKVLRFFVNHPKLLDFSIASQLAPSQEVTLSPEDLRGDRAIELRAGSFSLASNLQIFITEGMTKGHHRIDIDSLTLYGAPVEISKKASDASVGFSLAPGQSSLSQVPKPGQEHGIESTSAKVHDSAPNNTTTINMKHSPGLQPATIDPHYFNTAGVDINAINSLVQKLTQEESEYSDLTSTKKFDRQKHKNPLEARKPSKKPSAGGQSKKKTKKSKQ